MQPSRYNIVTRLEATDDYVIVNLLSGHADLVSEREAQALLSSSCHDRRFIERGYLVDPAEEQMLFRMKYIDFLESREQEEVQVFFVPTYHCNFDCTYCYQSCYTPEEQELSPGVISAFFRYVDQHLSGKQRYVTLFGGEPLLPGQSYHESIDHFISLCGQSETDLAIVTNGYHLDKYFDDFHKARIREVQITLDGTREVHDARRPLKGGKPSFDVIVSNLETCLELGYQVNLRVVIDRHNMHSLKDLARFAVDRGWTEHPLFKTQLGRNYELHHCHSKSQKLYSRLDLYKDLYRLIRQHPEISDFHTPAFSITKFLFDNGSLPPPLFDACPGCKSEWALDYTGTIYPCTATVGRTGEELGSFYPEVRLDHHKISAWKNRDVTTIEACHHCSVQLACGGGCGSLAKNSNGHLLTPDCRPVKELIGLGSAFYFS